MGEHSLTLRCHQKDQLSLNKTEYEGYLNNVLFFPLLVYSQNIDSLIKIYNEYTFEEIKENKTLSSFEFYGFNPMENQSQRKFKSGYNADGECIRVQFNINEIPVIFDRISSELDLYVIRQVMEHDTIFNQGFITFLDNSIYYISFQNEPESFKHGQFFSRTGGHINILYSISKLDNHLKTEYILFYKEKELLSICVAISVQQ